MHGKALKLRLELSRLARRHGVIPEPCIVPLSEPVDGPQVLEGYAATCDADRERLKFRAYAFGYPLLFRRGLPPLYYRHDETRLAGRIDSLEYDATGQLKVRATVTHEQARRCPAFSIGARVLEYEICDADAPSFYGLVTCAEITEISTTDRPANSAALVQRRYPASPAIALYETMGQFVSRLDKLVELMEANHEREGPGHARHPAPRGYPGGLAGRS